MCHRFAQALRGTHVPVASTKVDSIHRIEYKLTSNNHPWQECVEAAKGADLVVLEGMGRAIETNLNTKFTCDALKLGLNPMTSLFVT